MTPIEEYRITDNKTVWKRLHKQYLGNIAAIHCTYCRPHRFENARRRPRDDRYKSINRDTIRKGNQPNA